MRCYLSIALMLISGATNAAPPAPLPSGDAELVESYIKAIQMNDVPAYAATLSDKVRVTQDGAVVATNKAEWIKKFSDPSEIGPNHHVKSEGAWIGADYAAHTPRGDMFQAMILERIEAVFGDCCVYHRVDMLTLDGGKVVQLDLSRQYDHQLQNNGRPQGAR